MKKNRQKDYRHTNIDAKQQPMAKSTSGNLNFLMPFRHFYI